MQNRLAMRAYSFFELVLMLISCLLLFAGCQSTDKNESYFDWSKIEYANFEYDSESNQTKIIWRTTLTNNTIYDFDGFSVTFKLYNNSTLVTTKSYHYSLGVKHGAVYTSTFNFNAENEIDAIEFISWTVNYDSLWGTYKIWFIVTIVIACAVALVYIITMIIQDLELGDIGDWLSEHWWIFSILLAPFAGIIWGSITSNWVPVLIVFGGIVAIIVLCLVAHLLKLIITCIVDIVEDITCNVSFGGGMRGANRGRYDSEGFERSIENIEDYLDDADNLMFFSVQQLKEYCRQNGIKGYSSLNKENLVELIVKSSGGELVVSQEKTTRKSPSSKGNNITFDDIAGLEQAKIAFREKVVYVFEHKELYEKYGKKVGGGLLLYGLPGTGKTMFAEAASNETDSLFIPIKCSDIKSKWYGESEANVKAIFERARKAGKAIIFFDEFEAIGAKRTDNGESGNNDLVPQILAEMQGIGSNSAKSIIMVIAATNKPWAIDSAFLRPGRFDEKIYIPLPDLEARKKLFELKLKPVPQEGLDYDYLANITEGFNGADIGAFCDKMKMLAINKSIVNGKECPITMEEVLQVESSIKSSVSNEDMERLLEFREQFS